MHSYPVIERNTEPPIVRYEFPSPIPPPPSLSNLSLSLSLRITATVSSFRRPSGGDAYKVILAKFVCAMFRLHENFPSRKLLG